MVHIAFNAAPAWRPGVKLSNMVMAELLQRVAQSADAEAFNELFETYAPRIKAYMLRSGADDATAEELAQETLLTVWRKAQLYSAEKGSATTWIFTIARNLRIDRLRKEVAWQELPSGRDEEACTDALPDEEVSRSEDGVRIRKALEELPEDQRSVVWLSFIDGLSHNEIATRLNLPLGTVKSRMRLAYHKIREAVEDFQ